MATKKRKWLPIVAGIIVLLVFAAIGVAVAGVMLFRENVNVARETSIADADKAFAEALAPFADQRPLLTLDEDRQPSRTPGIESRKNPGRVEALHVLAWDADNGALARVTLPMWLLRFKPGPIVLGGDMDELDVERLQLTTDELEQRGPGVVLRFESRDGDKVLLTAGASPAAR